MNNDILYSSVWLSGLLYAWRLDKIEYNITNKEVAIAQLSTYRTKWSSSLKSSNHTHHIPMKLALYTIVSILRILSI